MCAPLPHPHPPTVLALLRGLDATFDRWTEALRTVEDVLRFVRSLPTLPGRFKGLRHRVAALRTAVESHAGAPLANFRDVASDLGRPRTDPRERPDGYDHDPDRAGDDALLGANLARARESARSTEELLRALPGADALAAEAEALRYAIYTADGWCEGLLRRAPRLADVRLYALVTTSLCNGNPREVTRAAIRGGVQMIQLREKSMPQTEFLALARDLREITAEAGVVFLINDDLGIAALCGADGVHQGQEDLPPNEVRKVLGPDAIVGVSTHDPEQARRAEADGADYIGVGPVFETKTKEHRAAVGLDYVRAAREAVSIPGYAIGSVNRKSLGDVLDAGAERVAVCTGIIAAEDVEGTARWFRDELDRRPLGRPESEGTP